LSTRVEYPMSLNRSWDYDCSVVRGFSAATRVSVFLLTYTDFSVFANSHGFSCHTDFRLFVSSASSRRHTEFRVFGDTRFSVSHGVPYLRVFAFLRNSNCIFNVWSFERPRTCSSVRPLRNIDPPGRNLPFSASLLSRRWRIASSTSFLSAWASVRSASPNHTSVHRLSPNDFHSPSRRHHPIDYHSRRFSPD
jgi:hypothetical protein